MVGGTTSGETLVEATALFDLAFEAQEDERYEDAVRLYVEALAIERELQQRRAEGNVLNNLGICYAVLGDYQRAIQCHEQALIIRRAPLIGSRIAEAQSLSNLGLCYYNLGDYGRAIDCFRVSLEIALELSHKEVEAAALGNLGICHQDLGDYDQAIDYYERSLAIKRGFDDREGEARSLGNLAGIHFLRSDWNRAIDCYQESLALFVEAEDQGGCANSLVGLGSCRAALLEYLEAASYYEQALAMFRGIGDGKGTALTLCNLGVCHESLSEYDRAIDFYEKALALALELGNRETQHRAHRSLGRSYRETEQPETAAAHYQSAVAIVESIRTHIDDEKLRESYFGSLRSLYEEYLELLLELGEKAETILVAERLRARTFLDALYQSGLALEQMHVNVVGVTGSEDQAVPVMDTEALQLAVEEAQSSLLPNEAVLEYMVGDDAIYLWIVQTDRVLGPRRIPYDREQLLRDVVALRRAIEPEKAVSDGEPELPFGSPTGALEELYGALLKPALVQLGEEIDTLIFIPSGPLWYVPFAALAMTDRPEIRIGGSSVAPKRPTYLVEEYTIAFLPSLASLPMLSEGTATAGSGYLAFANPTLSADQQTAVGAHYQHSVLETACRTFASQVGGINSDVHVQTDAREALAHTVSPGQRVLMYACHGDFNPSVPLASRLLLAPSELDLTGASEDRRLPDGDYHASEVLLTDHRGVDLVVLAACETLLPALREIQGLLGLTLGPESDDALTLEQLELTKSSASPDPFSARGHAPFSAHSGRRAPTRSRGYSSRSASITRQA